MTRGHGSKEFWLAALRTNGAAMRTAFEEAAAGGGLEAPVPSCPDWRVIDLIHHVGRVYLRVRSHVSRGVIGKPESDPAEGLGGLPTGAAAVQWWTDEHQQLLTLLDALDPQMPAWTWPATTKQVGFWHRRMAHETAIHRWDAQMALAQAEPIESKLATDGVSEVLDTWLPAGRRKGPVDRTGVVQLVAADAEEDWYVRLRGEGVALLDTDTWLDADDPHARVLARGTASDLVLALFGRVPFDVLEITGDATLLEPLRTG